MGSFNVHGIPAYTTVQMGRNGHCGLPMAWDPWDTSMGSQHTPRYRWVGTDTVGMGSLGYVHGIPAYTTVQMGRDGHCGLSMTWDPWDTSMGSQHTPWYRWVGMDTVDYQWQRIPRIRPWDPSIHHGTEG